MFSVFIVIIIFASFLFDFLFIFQFYSGKVAAFGRRARHG